MNLYLTHATSFDYKAELYEPLKHSVGLAHTIFYPHDEHPEGVQSKDVIAKSDVVLAEVSYPSTGQGIELGWADAQGVPILCFYRKGKKASGALQFLRNCTVIEYDSNQDMTNKIAQWLAESQ